MIQCSTSQPSWQSAVRVCLCLLKCKTTVFVNNIPFSFPTYYDNNETFHIPHSEICILYANKFQTPIVVSVKREKKEAKAANELKAENFGAKTFSFAYRKIFRKRATGPGTISSFVATDQNCTLYKLYNASIPSFEFRSPYLSGYLMHIHIHRLKC